jgi:hypothetical protein
MTRQRTDRQILTILATAAAALALASLALGLFSGRATLGSVGLSGFATMLAGIPVASAVVVLVLTPLMFVIGVGLLSKGVCESRRRTEVAGTLVESHVKRVPGDTQDDWIVVSRVAYHADGAPREAAGDHAELHPTEAAARAHLERLHVGDPVRVFYRPGAPDRIHLDAPPTRTGTVFAVGAWITLMGCFAWFVTGVTLAR